MTTVYPLYNYNQMIGGLTNDDWDMDRWEDDGGKSISTANNPSLH
ncbi:MAG: hypothetical protein RR587_02920 [Solibacillus sp.]